MVLMVVRHEVKSRDFLEEVNENQIDRIFVQHYLGYPCFSVFQCLKSLHFSLMDREHSDQTMCIIWVFSGRPCKNSGFIVTLLYRTGQLHYKWASPRENLSSGFPPKRVSNQSPQLQRLAKKLKFHL